MKIIFQKVLCLGFIPCLWHITPKILGISYFVGVDFVMPTELLWAQLSLLEWDNIGCSSLEVYWWGLFISNMKHTSGDWELSVQPPELWKGEWRLAAIAQEQGDVENMQVGKHIHLPSIYHGQRGHNVANPLFPHTLSKCSIWLLLVCVFYNNIVNTRNIFFLTLLSHSSKLSRCMRELGELPIYSKPAEQVVLETWDWHLKEGGAEHLACEFGARYKERILGLT